METLDSAFLGHWGEQRSSIPFAHKWLKSSERDCLKSPNRPHMEALRVGKSGQKHYLLAIIGCQITCRDPIPTTFQSVF